MALLGGSDVAPVRVENADGKSRFFLTADHAGRAIPAALGDLGVRAAEMDRHIAWDIGIAGVTSRLAVALDATAVFQAYSRLVIDCNRQTYVASAFPVVSEATPIPGNVGLHEDDKLARQREIFEPYHHEIKRLLTARTAMRPIYVAMHSFTPVYLNVARPMHVAVLYNRRPAFSKLVAALLRREAGLMVAENEPYRVSDETDYGVPVHAEAAGLDYVEVEIRQDLIASERGQAEWAARLAGILPLALAQLEENGL